jgi:hypothetical protein
MKETNPFFLTKVILFTPLRSAGAIFWGSEVRFLGCDFWGAIFWGAISGVRFLGCDIWGAWGAVGACIMPPLTPLTSTLL